MTCILSLHPSQKESANLLNLTLATMNHILHKEIIVLLDYSSSLYEIKSTKKL